MDMNHPSSAGPSHTPMYPCFWNHCHHTFPSRPSLRAHFDAQHAPSLLPELVPGQRLRRHPQGGWERVGEAVSLSHNLPIPPFSQTTGDITTTTTTDTTFPLPSFGSLPPPPSFPSFATSQSQPQSQSQSSQPLQPSPHHHSHRSHQHQHQHALQRQHHHHHHHDHPHHPHEHHTSYPSTSASASASHLSQEMLSHRIATEFENPYPTAIATSAILPPPKLSEPLSRSSSISLSPSDRSPSPSPQPHPQLQLQPQPRLPSHSVHATHSVEILNTGDRHMPPPQSPRSVRVRSEANAAHAMAHHREGVAPHSGNMDVDVDMSFGSALAPYAGPSQVEVGPGLGSGSGWFGSFSTPEHVSPYVPVTQVIPSSFPSSPSFTMRSHQAPQGAFVSPSALPLDNPGHTSSSGVNAVASVTTEANACDSPSASANTTADIPASPAPSSVEAPRSRAPSLSHSLPLRFGAALEPELPVSANHTTTTTTTTPGRAFAPAPAPAPRNGNAVGFAFGLAGAASGEAKRGRFPAESGPPEPQSKSLSQTPAQSQAFSSRARKVSNAERVGFSWGMGQ